MNFRATPRRLIRRFAAVTGAGLLVLGLGATSAAQGVPVPQSPSDPAFAEEWVSESARPGESDSPVRMDLVEAPTLVDGPLTAGATLTLTIRLTNTTQEPIEQLTVTPQRAEGATSVSQARSMLAGPSSNFGYYAQSVLVDGLAPEEQRDITLNVDTDPAEDSTLSITQAGTYPVLVSLLGTDPTSGAPGLLSSERFALPVTDRAAAPANPPAPTATEEEATPGLSMIYPVTADVDITPGETGDAPGQQPLILSSEQVAEQLGPDGRLSRLLDVYADSAPSDGTCLAVDPELVDVVDRMSRGYSVSDYRPLPERPQRLRDSWGDTDEGQTTVPGGGAELAEEWITRLTDIAATECLISLPWANADLNALSATGDRWLMREALERGPTTLHRVLGTTGLTNTVLAPTGYVDPAATRTLGWADHSDSTVGSAGMTTAWEQSVSQRAADDSSALGTDAPAPQEPVRVLVANNTVWGDQTAGRFSNLAPGITAVGFHDSLAATFAATGTTPETVAYSNPDLRHPLELDSPLARDLSAMAALQLAVAEQAEDAPVLATLSLALDPSTAQRTLDMANALIDSGQAEPLSLTDYLTPSSEETAELTSTPSLIDEEQPPFGTPYSDPGLYSDPEILRASQQARYTDDLTRILSNDPALALTRYGYTLPLRRDQIRALSAVGRRSFESFDEAVTETDELLRGNGFAVQQLRSSILLLPPGNVYTRTSENSPLLIVAENRLPLPVEAMIEYDSADPVRLDAPNPVRIPAHGSLTVQMTADLPDRSEQSQLRVWLANLNGSQISTPVELTVQTRGTTLALVAATALLGLVLFLGSVIRLLRRRQRPPVPDEPPDSS